MAQAPAGCPRSWSAGARQAAVCRVARGFRVCAQALDGVIEGIESHGDWWALAVQWNPAAATASGLDIQLFRGLVEASLARLQPVPEGEHAAA